MAKNWWWPYEGHIVGYVLEKHGKFIPNLAICRRDFGQRAEIADDCILVPYGKGPGMDTAESAVRYFEEHDPGIEVKEIFPKPIRPNMCGMTFLMEPYIALHGKDPRESVN